MRSRAPPAASCPAGPVLLPGQAPARPACRLTADPAADPAPPLRPTSLQCRPLDEIDEWCAAADATGKCTRCLNGFRLSAKGCEQCAGTMMPDGTEFVGVCSEWWVRAARAGAGRAGSQPSPTQAWACCRPGPGHGALLPGAARHCCLARACVSPAPSPQCPPPTHPCLHPVTQPRVQRQVLRLRARQLPGRLRGLPAGGAGGPGRVGGGMQGADAGRGRPGGSTLSVRCPRFVAPPDRRAVR